MREPSILVTHHASALALACFGFCPGGLLRRGFPHSAACEGFTGRAGFGSSIGDAEVASRS